MTIAINKAWKENLTFSEDCQYKTKEEIIEDCCPEYNLFEGINLNSPMYCKGNYDKECCTTCWDRDIETNKKTDNIKIPKFIHNDIIKSDNDRIQELYEEFINGEALGTNYIQGVYMFLQFILKHE